MSSPVDICNQALALLGDAARVTSIDPPDQSAQAGHCARFYPISVLSLQEMHNWGFCTVREPLAEVDNPSSTWQYAYAAPSAIINYLAVLDPQAADDIEVGVPVPQTYPGMTSIGAAVYTAQPFQVETSLVDGSDLILTNQADAVLRYTRYQADSTKFSPLFVETLSMLLAAKLAGPLIKGAEGRKASLDIMKTFFSWWKEQAVESDSNQRRTVAVPAATWITNR